MALNSVLLLLFLKESDILDGETSAENLLKIFAKYISEKGAEEEEDNY